MLFLRRRYLLAALLVALMMATSSAAALFISVGNDTAVNVTWGDPSAWTGATMTLPCVADDVVVSNGVDVAIAGRARAHSITLQPLSRLTLMPGATLELPSPTMPQPFWCSVATPYPVTPPVAVNATASVLTLSATLNVAMTPTALRTSLAEHFRDDNGLPLTFALVWTSSSAAAVDADAATWLLYNDANGLATGTPLSGSLALTQSTYLAIGSNGVNQTTASAAFVSVVVNVNKRPPYLRTPLSSQSVWNLPVNTIIANSDQALYNMTGLVVDPDDFPLTFWFENFPSTTTPTFDVDANVLVPYGKPTVVGSYNVTLFAQNNVTQLAPPFNFTVVVYATCSSGNYAPPLCDDCKAAFYGSSCQYSSGACAQHGTVVVTGPRLSAFCNCSSGYSGSECTTPVSNDNFSSAALSSNAIAAIAASAAGVVLIVVLVAVVLIVRARRKNELERNYRDGKVKEADAEILYASLTKWRPLGEGEFGSVQQAWWDVHSIYVAVKEVKAERATAQQMRSLVEEGIQMKSLGSAAYVNIVQYYGLCVDNKPNMYLVLEYCDGGSLLECLLHPRDDWHLTFARRREILLNVAAGMEVIGRHGMVHRDLAARNVFLYKRDNEIRGKVGDLGMARATSFKSAASDDKVPVRWCAPEVLSALEYSPASDVWSFGVLYWETFSSGQTPYPDCRTNQQAYARIVAGALMPRPSECPRPDYGIMQRCWHRSPTARPSFTELKGLMMTVSAERKGSSDDAPPPYGGGSSPTENQTTGKSYSQIPLTTL